MLEQLVANYGELGDKILKRIEDWKERQSEVMQLLAKEANSLAPFRFQRDEDLPVFGLIERLLPTNIEQPPGRILVRRGAQLTFFPGEDGLIIARIAYPYVDYGDGVGPERELLRKLEPTEIDRDRIREVITTFLQKVLNHKRTQPLNFFALLADGD